MKSFYLIGNSTEKSLSPLIHKWIYEILNINASYSTQNIVKTEFKNTIKSILNEMNTDKIHGINITNPYKTSIIPSGISLSADAEKINAVNCIYKKNGKIVGENTDWVGFIQSLVFNNIILNDYNVIILGAGGVSRSIIYALQKENIKVFQVYNRTNFKNFQVNGNSYKILSLSDISQKLPSNSLIINCMTSGIIENNNILSGSVLENSRVFYDLNYHKSKFHYEMGKDIKVILGLDMLIYQAIKSVELWFNCKIIKKIEMQRIKKYLKETSKC